MQAHTQAQFIRLTIKLQAMKKKAQELQKTIIVISTIKPEERPQTYKRYKGPAGWKTLIIGDKPEKIKKQKKTK